jgi:hypothetical protein
MAAVAPTTPARNDTLTPSTEQTGTLAVRDRAVAFASSPGGDNIAGLSVGNYSETKEGSSASVLASGNPPRSIADDEKLPATQTAGWQVPSRRNSVTITGHAGWSYASGGVWLVSGRLKAEARFGRRRHIIPRFFCHLPAIIAAHD